jgi:hypothetical protein
MKPFSIAIGAIVLPSPLSVPSRIVTFSPVSTMERWKYSNHLVFARHLAIE